MNINDYFLIVSRKISKHEMLYNWSDTDSIRRNIYFKDSIKYKTEGNISSRY